jgi:D-alanyl-D-alanine carboxypeptidase/D-alanyl-D-alanine-endopeptidase (penicillin-binding protein 4)
MSISFLGTIQCNLVLLAILAICAVGSAPAVADPSPTDQVKDTIDKTLVHPYQANAFQGIYVQSMDTGKVIYEHNGDKMMTPASCMKILVSAASLDTLGPDYKVTTSMYATAKPTNGVLHGNIVLVGQGDTSLRLEDLRQFALQLKQSGVKKIKGDIVGDDTWYEGESLSPGCCWDDEPYYYGAPVSALSVNENYVSVFVKPGEKAGDKAIVELQPSTAYFTVQNHAVTGEAGSPSTADATRPRATNIIDVTGSVPLGYKPAALVPESAFDYVRVHSLKPGEFEPEPTERLSAGDPAIFVCTLFKEILQSEGIKVDGHITRGQKSESDILIASHDSPPLSKIVTMQNKPSDNFMAESMLKMLGKVVKGKGTFDAGIDAETEWLKKIGVDTKHVSIADGSGLSRRNSIPAESLAKILTYVYHTKNYDILANSFPIAGVDSHLKDRMLNSPAVNNVKAKTGYLRLVCSLSGYVKTLAKENLAVSVIQNNHVCSLDEAYWMQDVIFVALSRITTRTDAIDIKAER